MTWDPEIDDPTRPRPAPDEPSDYGADPARDLGDEPAPAYRTAAPDLLSPIDPNAPVSGHSPPRSAPSASTTVEHDWAAARSIIQPVLRPPGTLGVKVADADVESLAAASTRHHSNPLVDDGPAGLVVAFSLPSSGFDVIVNGDHVLSWGVPAAEVRDTALANLARWSAEAPWTGEEDGGRKLLSSDTGEGPDAARILLPEVRRHIEATLGSAGRVLVGLPERHLLVAGALRPDDPEFATLVAQFVGEAADAADEPIDRRLFTLAAGELVPFAPPEATTAGDG